MPLNPLAYQHSNAIVDVRPVVWPHVEVEVLRPLSLNVLLPTSSVLTSKPSTSIAILGQASFSNLIHSYRQGRAAQERQVKLSRDVVGVRIGVYLNKK